MIPSSTRLPASRLATRRLSWRTSRLAAVMTNCQDPHQHHCRGISFSIRPQAYTGNNAVGRSGLGSRHQGLSPPRRLFSASPALSSSPSTFKPLSNSDITSLSQHFKSHNKLWENIHKTCSRQGFGAAHRYGPNPNDTGMNRLALTDADKAVRDWFVTEAKSLGCQVDVDEMGNIWAIKPGVSSSMDFSSLHSPPPIMMGSHLDTQPRGGRYDGILGIMAGLEALRTLKETGTKTWRPVGVVCWTNEEGARFPISMVSSGVWAGQIPLSAAHSLREVAGEGRTMREELERIGYLGEKKCNHKEMPMAAHFELHIEQGPILEANSKKIGVVVGSQAYKWFTVEVTGKEAHTGTTPYSQRADALVAATAIIQHARSLGEEGILVSVGVFQVYPGSVNTIPGLVRFSLDIRSPSTSTLETFTTTLRRELEAVAANAQDNSLPCQITTWIETTNSPAQLFHPSCIAAVKGSALSVLAEENGGDLERARELVEMEMTSGAGHDSVYTAKVCPTSMIFVKSKGGVSHHPEEFTGEEDCVRGGRVLLEGVLRFDRGVWEEDGGGAKEED